MRHKLKGLSQAKQNLSAMRLNKPRVLGREGGDPSTPLGTTGGATIETRSGMIVLPASRKVKASLAVDANGGT